MIYYYNHNIDVRNYPWSKFKIKYFCCLDKLSLYVGSSLFITKDNVETSRDSYIGRNPLPKLRTHKPTRTTRVLQTVVA